MPNTQIIIKSTKSQNSQVAEIQQKSPKVRDQGQEYCGIKA